MIEGMNFVGGRWIKGSGASIEVDSPWTGKVIGKIASSTKEDVAAAVEVAKKASIIWAATPTKERAQILLQFRNILLRDLEKIGKSASDESGKLVAEGKAGLMKGIEVLEYALSLQNLDAGARIEVSRGVFCEYRREALGVVAGIVPFNFPAMVPMWMIPIALAVGNAFILKPSDKVPLTAIHIANALKEAGLPDGVFTILQGGRDTVEAIIDHKDISAIGFVGSSTIAKAVYVRGTSLGKRVLALGGAKNPNILMPDADFEMASRGITDSFTGCAGQRCMAASVLLAVGDCDKIISGIVEKSKAIKLGVDMGALITKESHARITKAIDRAVSEGAKLLLDGRGAKPANADFSGGYWLGPTIIDGVKPGSEAACDELFGPVLSIVRVTNLTEALEFEAASDYGNACSVFTQNGTIAERVAKESTAGMIGINIGVPVPREPFSFGGTKTSKYGTGDITGYGGVEFWSKQKKITTKWAAQSDKNWMN